MSPQVAKRRRLLAELYSARVAGDLPAALGLLREMRNATVIDLHNEAVLAGHEYCVTMGAAILADWYVCLHQYAPATQLLFESWGVLNARDARRAARGLGDALCTDVRIRLLSVMADLKWRWPDHTLRTFMLHASAMLDQWQVYSSRVDDLYSAEASEPERGRADVSPVERVRQHAEALLNCGASLATVLHRDCPERLVELRREFDSWHLKLFGGGGLESPGSTVWCWLHRAGKVWTDFRGLSAGVSVGDVEQELEQIYNSLMAITARGKDGVFAAAVERDREWMLNDVRSRMLRFEVRRRA